jgi:serine/threonine protein kinase
MPPSSELKFITNQRARVFVRKKLGLRTGISFEHFFADADQASCDLLRKLLVINPKLRMTIDEALEHPCFESFYKAEEVATLNQGAAPFTFAYDDVKLTKDELKTLIQAEDSL